MGSNNDKWIMFKNYMHNELGITKDDIRSWIKEAAEEQAGRLVEQEFGKFDVKRTFSKRIELEFQKYSSSLRNELIRGIVDVLDIKIKDKHI